MCAVDMRNNDNLRTPKYITDALGHFDLDPCAGEHTCIANVNYWDGRGQNGLILPWFGMVFCNPPFSQKQLWIDKMIQHDKGFLLLPERGSAPWFAPLAEKAGYYFVMGKKINFEGGSSSNNIGSVLFCFGAEARHRIVNSNLPGHFVTVNWINKRHG